MTVSFGHRRLGEGVEQLGPVLDDAAVLLRGAGQESRHVLERDERDVEAVAEPDEAGALERGGDVEAPRQVRRLVRHDPDRPAPEPAEADDQVRRVLRLDLEEVLVVEDRLDQLLHVVRLGRIVGHEALETLVHPVRRIRRRAQRGILEVVRRQEAQELPDRLEARVLALGGQVGDPRDPRVGVGPAQLLEGHLLVGHGLEDLGAGHEHVGRPADHEREVRDRRRVHRAAGARAHDRRDLRHHARGEHVPEEDVGVAGERDHALLDARPAGVVQPDDRHADLEGQVHDLADLLRVGQRERAPEHGEVLGEEVDRPPVDPRGPGDHAVAQDAAARSRRRRCAGWTTNRSSSSKDPLSTRPAIRSRAVRLPAACWRAIRSGPPPSSAAARSRVSSAKRSSRLNRRSRIRERGGSAT